MSTLQLLLRIYLLEHEMPGIRFDYKGSILYHSSFNILKHPLPSIRNYWPFAKDHSFSLASVISAPRYLGQPNLFPLPENRESPVAQRVKL